MFSVDVSHKGTCVPENWNGKNPTNPPHLLPPPLYWVSQSPIHYASTQRPSRLGHAGMIQTSGWHKTRFLNTRNFAISKKLKFSRYLDSFTRFLKIYEFKFLDLRWLVNSWNLATTHFGRKIQEWLDVINKIFIYPLWDFFHLCLSPILPGLRLRLNYQ